MLIGQTQRQILAEFSKAQVMVLHIANYGAIRDYEIGTQS
jgi:hypothetical protein